APAACASCRGRRRSVAAGADEITEVLARHRMERVAREAARPGRKRGRVGQQPADRLSGREARTWTGYGAVVHAQRQRSGDVRSGLAGAVVGAQLAAEVV